MTVFVLSVQGRYSSPQAVRTGGLPCVLPCMTSNPENWHDFETRSRAAAWIARRRAWCRAHGASYDYTIKEVT